MRRWVDRLLTGYLVQAPVLLFVAVLAFIGGFFDTFYNRFILEPILGRPIPGGGLAMSAVIAILLGITADTKRGWVVLSRFLSKIPIINFLPTLVDQWKKFRVFAKEHGIILAPYYRDKSGFWPGVVTGTLPTDDGGYLVSVVFIDLPLPKPLLLSKDDIVYTKLTAKEAFDYIVSGGLGFKMLTKRLKAQPLKDLISQSFFEHRVE